MSKTKTPARRSKRPPIGRSDARLSIWNLVPHSNVGAIVATFDMSIGLGRCAIEIRGIRLVRRGPAGWSVEPPYLNVGGQLVHTVDLPWGIWEQARRIAIERYKLACLTSLVNCRMG